MSTMDQFVNHLEFLGYEVERRDGDLIKAKHQSNANFLFHIFGFGAMAKAMFGVNSQGKNRRGDVLERLNSYNSVARFPALISTRILTWPLKQCFRIFMTKLLLGSSLKHTTTIWACWVMAIRS